MNKTIFATALVTGLGLSSITSPAMAYEAGDWLIMLIDPSSQT